MPANPSLPPSSTRPVDRRVRRSRQAIRDAFVPLVLERGYDRISVEDIIQSADVARATFYAHFNDKHDLLTAIVRDLATDLTERALPLAPTQGVLRGAALAELFRHVGEHQEVYRLTLSGAASGQARAAYAEVICAAITRVFSAAVAASDAAPRVPVDVLAHAWTGTHIALVEWWLTEEPHRTADEVTVIAMQLLIRGFVWAGGLEDAGLSFDDSALRPPAEPSALP